MPAVVRVSRADLLVEVRKLIGTPFVHQGRLAGVGVDCVGVAAVPMRALGMTVPDLATYDRFSAGLALPTQLALIADRIPLEDAKPGDGLAFRRWRQHREEHFGWLSGFWTVVHAWDRSKGVVEHDLDQRWRDRLEAVYRFREVA